MPDWDNRYQHCRMDEALPARVVLDFAHLLPSSGTALDLACGLGGNAIFLANKGLETYAWDSSAVAIERLQNHAITHNLPLHASIHDVVASPPPAGQFDVIIVSRFLYRGLETALIDALGPGGLLFYQTFVRDKAADIGPRNPEYLLGENELLHLFNPLIIRAYREEGLLGDVAAGWRSEAMLVGQKARA